MPVVLGTNSNGFVDGQHESAGIYVDVGMNGAEISGNVIKGATRGVFLHGSSNNDVHNNIISEYRVLLDSEEGVGISLMPINGAAMAGNSVDNNVTRFSSPESSLGVATSTSETPIANEKLSFDDVTDSRGSTPDIFDQALAMQYGYAGYDWGWCHSGD